LLKISLVRIIESDGGAPELFDIGIKRKEENTIILSDLSNFFSQSISPFATAVTPSSIV